MEECRRSCVVGEVAGDVVAGLAAVLVFGHFEFGLDGAEAGFHKGVVVTIGGPAHALAELGAAENGSVLLAGVLPAAVAVMDQTGSRLPITDGVAQRIEDATRHGVVRQFPYGL